jgi:hypothetical protein
MTKTANEIVDLFTRGDRDFQKRWLTAKQVEWLLKVWKSEGREEPSSYWSHYTGTIADKLADGALWTLTYYYRTGRAYLDVTPSAAQMAADVAAAQASDESFF